MIPAKWVPILNIVRAALSVLLFGVGIENARAGGTWWAGASLALAVYYASRVAAADEHRFNQKQTLEVLVRRQADRIRRGER